MWVFSGESLFLSRYRFFSPCGSDDVMIASLSK